MTFRAGWAKAVARPWNDASPDASLRLVRGSAEFVEECATALCGYGVQRVLSPPLDDSQAEVWRTAGFAPALALDVHVCDLLGRIADPSHDVVEGDEEDWVAAVAIDDASFSDEWRMGALGLAEARDATPRATFLVVRDPGLVGFVIVGAAVSTAYLQRIAVDPAARGRGIGRSLVRAACRWGAGQGAARIVLNTQPDNVVAAGLYASEGFRASPGALSVLARDC